MRKLMLLAGAAALTAAFPVIAAEKGRGNGRGGGQAAERSQKGGGAARADRGRQRNEQPRAEARGRGKQDSVDRRGGGNGRSAEHAARGQGRDRTVDRAVHAQRGREHPSRVSTERGSDRAQARREIRRDSDQRLVIYDRRVDVFERGRIERARGVGPNGCPPGLARKNPYCMPPGQLRRAAMIGQRLPASNWGYGVPERYRYRFTDSGDWIYRYDDSGYVYRLARNGSMINAIYPLYGNDLYLGEPMPLGYDVYNVPLAYRSYYPDGSDYLYRYDDGAIYRVNNDSMMVEGIAALLTGGVGGLGGLGVGDVLPSGYEAYNVPLDYRDRYADSNDAWYRYADQSIYQVDPQTRMIEEIISLIA